MSIGTATSETVSAAFFSVLFEFTATVEETIGCSSLGVFFTSREVLPLWTRTVFFVEQGTMDFLVFLVIGSCAVLSADMAVASETIKTPPVALPME
jgi:hypothetical protein